MTLLDYFKINTGQWLSRADLADFLGCTERKVQDFVSELNDRLSVEGGRFLVCSSTGKPSGYCYTDDSEVTERSLRQLRSHALGELKKLKVVRIALKRQSEWQIRKQPDPIVEPNNQLRLF